MNALKQELSQLIAVVPYWKDRGEHARELHVGNSARFGEIVDEIAVRKEFADKGNDLYEREKLIAQEVDARVKRRVDSMRTAN